VASGQISINHLASGVLASPVLLSGVVTSGHIASGQVGNFHLSSGSAAGNISGNTVYPTTIYTSTITGRNGSGSLTINTNDSSLGKIVLVAGTSNVVETASPFRFWTTDYDGIGGITDFVYKETNSGLTYRNLSGLDQLVLFDKVYSGSVASGQISINHLASGVLASPILLSGVVVSGNIASGQVGSFHLSSGSVVSGRIASGQIGSFHIASGGVLSGNIASGQIGINHLASGVIGGGTPALTSGIVTSGHIASGQIGQFHLANNVVSSGKLASGSISRFDVGSGAINSGHLADNCVVSGSVASGQISINHLASGVIGGGTPTLTSGVVTSGHIASGQIGVYHLASGLPVLYNNNNGSGQQIWGSGNIFRGLVVCGGYDFSAPVNGRLRVQSTDWINTNGVIELTNGISKTEIGHYTDGSYNRTVITNVSVAPIEIGPNDYSTSKVGIGRQGSSLSGKLTITPNSGQISLVVQNWTHNADLMQLADSSGAVLVNVNSSGLIAAKDMSLSQSTLSYSGKLDITTQSGKVGLVVKNHTHTKDLIQLSNSSGALLTKVDYTGSLTSKFLLAENYVSTPIVYLTGGTDCFIQFTPTEPAGCPDGSIFIDSNDNTLKYRGIDSNVYVINIT
jgi:hypothetical protein